MRFFAESVAVGVLNHHKTKKELHKNPALCKNAYVGMYSRPIQAFAANVELRDLQRDQLLPESRDAPP